MTESPLTHVNCPGEHLTFGQYCKSVVKVCYVVLGLVFVCVERFQVLHLCKVDTTRSETYLQLHGWVVFGDVVSGCSFIDNVESFMENTR